MAENEQQEKIESTNNIQNLIPVPQGCSYFLDTTNNNQQHIVGLITQGCGPCACIIVRNRDNTKTVLAHVDSGNDITDEEFGLPKWVRQCGNGDNVIVEVHMGCAYNPDVDRERITDDIESVRNKLGLNKKQIKINEDKTSLGGMILRKGYRVDFKVRNLETISDLASKSPRPEEKEKYDKAIQKIKELKSNLPVNRTDRLVKILAIEQQTTTKLIKPNTVQIINDNAINIPPELQLSFNNEITDEIFGQIKESISENVNNIIKYNKHNIDSYIEDTLNLVDGRKADSEFCQEHNIKVPLIPLDEISKFKNVLTEEFKNRINNQTYIKNHIKHRKELKKEEDVYAYRQNYWQTYIMERQKLSKETLEHIK